MWIKKYIFSYDVTMTSQHFYGTNLGVVTTNAKLHVSASSSFVVVKQTDRQKVKYTKMCFIVWMIAYQSGFCLAVLWS